MTFSAALRDPASGALGVLAATARPAVGARAILGGPDLVILSQGKASQTLAARLRDEWSRGAELSEAGARALAADDEPQRRQILALAIGGAPYVHSGSLLPEHSATAVGEDYVCAGNILSSPDVIHTMAEVCGGHQGDVADTLLAAGVAGEDAGGDARGRQSAALVVWLQDAWPVIDVRVDDHPDPLTELRRLVELWRETWTEYERTGEFPPAHPAWVRTGSPPATSAGHP